MNDTKIHWTPNNEFISSDISMKPLGQNKTFWSPDDDPMRSTHWLVNEFTIYCMSHYTVDMTQADSVSSCWKVRTCKHITGSSVSLWFLCHPQRMKGGMHPLTDFVAFPPPTLMQARKLQMRNFHHHFFIKQDKENQGPHLQSTDLRSIQSINHLHPRLWWTFSFMNNVTENIN